VSNKQRIAELEDEVRRLNVLLEQKHRIASDAIDFADEGWALTTSYFRDRRDYEFQRKRLITRLERPQDIKW
jgi:hypothetical protein